MYNVLIYTPNDMSFDLKKTAKIMIVGRKKNWCEPL